MPCLSIILGISSTIFIVLLYIKNSISLGYFLLLLLMVMSLSFTGFIISKLYECIKKIEINEQLFASMKSRIDYLEKNQNSYAKRKTVTQRSDNYQDEINIIQSQLSNHIASVNVAMMIISMITVLITVMVPVLNYTFLNKEQIENMYANVDSQLQNSIYEMNLHADNLLLEAQAKSDELINKKLDIVINDLEDKMNAMSEMSIFQSKMYSIQYEELNTKISSYTSLLSEYPNSAEIYYYRGCAYYDKKEYELAIDDLLKAKGLGYVDLRTVDRTLCYCYYYMNDYFSVIDICNTYIPEVDYMYTFTVIRADAYGKLGQYDKALNEYHAMIDSMSEGTHFIFQGYSNIARIYYNAGRYEEAIEYYTRAIEENPQDAFDYLSRGNIYYHSFNNYTEALNDFNKAIQLDPDLDIAYILRESVYFNTQDYYSALDDLNSAILLRNSPMESIYLYRQRGIIYLFHLDEYKQAINDFRITVALERDNAMNYTNLALAYYYDENYIEAIKYFSKALDINPNEKIDYEYRANSYQQIGEDALAQADIETLKELE